MNTNLPTNFAFTNMDPPSIPVDGFGRSGPLNTCSRCPFCGRMGGCGCCRRCPWCGGMGGCGCGRRWGGAGYGWMTNTVPENTGTCTCEPNDKNPAALNVTNMCSSGTIPVCVSPNKCECKVVLK